MAFTSQGMFYLGKEDLEPTVGLAGKSIRGMLGIQNEEEQLKQQKLAVNAIVKESDFSTEEGKKLALDKIKAVNPDAWMAFTDQLQKQEKAELEIKSMRGIPGKTTFFNMQVEPNLVRNFVKDAIGVENITTFTQFSNYLDNLVASGKIKTNERASKKSALKDLLKQEKKNWMSLNKYKTLEQIQAGYAPASSNVTSSNYTNMAKKVNVPPTEQPDYSGLGITQVNPKSSGFTRTFQGLNADAQIRGRVNQLGYEIAPSIFGSLTLNVEEEKLNERKKPAYNWFATDGRDYFLKNPKDLIEAEKNPLAWYEANIKKKNKK